MYSSKMIGNIPAALNFDRLFLKFNRFICNQRSVLPIHCNNRCSNRNATRLKWVLEINKVKEILKYRNQITIYSIDGSKVIGNFPAVLNCNRLFLKLNRFICN